MTDQQPDVDLFHTMSIETVCCYWCEQEAVGTARDLNGIPHYSCGQEGHGKP